jgi:hypothetical protein
MTPENKAALHAAAARKRLQQKEDQRKSFKVLPGGAKLYKDTLPGIGFVLEFPNGRKCYYMEPEVAEHLWLNKYADHWGTKDDRGVLVAA